MTTGLCEWRYFVASLLQPENFMRLPEERVQPEEEFRQAAEYVLRKNEELYRGLAS